MKESLKKMLKFCTRESGRYIKNILIEKTKKEQKMLVKHSRYMLYLVQTVERLPLHITCKDNVNVLKIYKFSRGFFVPLNAHI